jgi:alpha-tubulin suppressor-like RCC1 family protein
LFWQQQTTLASFVDSEYSKGTFSARTLEAITPTLDPSYSKVDASWDAASGNWATPQYTLDWSTNASGLGAGSVYDGPNTSASLIRGADAQTSAAVLFTDVSAGSTHACGIAHGSVYCWGTSAAGGLGLGTVTTATSPTLVGGALAGQQVLEVTSGTNFSCARVASGSAYCWGEGSTGQLGNGAGVDANTPQLVSGLSAVTSISAGTTHACAVSDGAAYCWGAGANYRLGNGSVANRNAPYAVTATGVLSDRTVSSISAGGNHSCAIADGRAFCWGYNAYGQLGDQTATNRTTPVMVLGATVLQGATYTRISAGSYSTCAVASGAAYCWGDNSYGQLGIGSTTASSAPAAVNTNTMSGAVTEISSGAYVTCAIAAANAYCWGQGANSQLGNGSTANATRPVLVTGTTTGRTLTKISAGAAFSCATGYTAASCWGWGSSGQIGDGNTLTRSVPVDVDLEAQTCPTGSVLEGSGCSLKEDTNYYLRLGYSVGTWTAPNSAWVKGTTLTRPAIKPGLDSRTSTSISLNWDSAVEPRDSYPEYVLQRSLSASGANPVTVGVYRVTSADDRVGVAPSQTWSAVSAGYTHTCGIVDAKLYCWGDNNYGQLGQGDTTARNAPTLVSALDGMSVTEVSAGYYATCAIADGTVYCWGYNNYGQLGDGSNTNRSSPTPVVGSGYTAVKISTDYYHTCGVISDGSAWCWGYDNYYQLGDNNRTNSNVPVPVQAGDIGGTPITDITVGYYHTCAIAGGAAYCWGRSNYGQAGMGTSTYRVPTAVNTSYGLNGKTVSSIVAGQYHTCAIADGAAYCWGRNDTGQLGIGSTTPTSTYQTRAVSTAAMSGTVTSISSDYGTNCAIADGNNFCWGLGTSGQIGQGANATVTSPTRVPSAGPLQSATSTKATAGYQHSCGIFDGLLYCWGVGTSGRLGNRETVAYNVPQSVIIANLCNGGNDLGDGTCSLAPSTTYYYRIGYSFDGGTLRYGSWVAVSTS